MSTYLSARSHATGSGRSHAARVANAHKSRIAASNASRLAAAGLALFFSVGYSSAAHGVAGGQAEERRADVVSDGPQRMWVCHKKAGRIHVSVNAQGHLHHEDGEVIADEDIDHTGELCESGSGAGGGTVVVVDGAGAVPVVPVVDGAGAVPVVPVVDGVGAVPVVPVPVVPVVDGAGAAPVVPVVPVVDGAAVVPVVPAPVVDGLPAASGADLVVPAPVVQVPGVAGGVAPEAGSGGTDGAPVNLGTGQVPIALPEDLPVEAPTEVPGELVVEHPVQGPVAPVEVPEEDVALAPPTESTPVQIVLPSQPTKGGGSVRVPTIVHDEPLGVDTETPTRDDNRPVHVVVPAQHGGQSGDRDRHVGAGFTDEILGAAAGRSAVNRPAALVLPQTGLPGHLALQAGAGLALVVAGGMTLLGRRRQRD